MKSVNKVIFIILACFLSSLLFASRAFSIGYIFAFWYLLLLKFPLKKNKINLIGIVTLIIVLVVSVCYIKPDSSLGRLLIYKISFNIFKDNYLFGVGFGRFNQAYMLYQYKYFSSGQNTVKELLLAGNTFYLYNDYFQLIIELGIGALILIFALLIGLLKMIEITVHDKNDYNFILLIAVSQLIALCIAACFDFVFERLFFQLLFSLCFLILLQNFLCKNKIIGYNKLTCGLGIVLLLCIGSRFRNKMLYFQAYKTFRQSQELSGAGFKTEAIDNLSKVYPYLEDDAEFLLFYGKELKAFKSYHSALTVLGKAKARIATNELYLEIGKCYFGNFQFKEAENAFRQSIYMVPNRFVTRYELYKFYMNTNQIQKALITKRDILSLPVKIRSRQIDFIKRELSFQ